MKNQKKVIIAPKPSQSPASLAKVDDWVGGDNSGTAPQALPVIPPAAPPVADVADNETVRLTIDIPKTLHTRFKLYCVGADKKLAEEVRELIATKVGWPD